MFIKTILLGFYILTTVTLFSACIKDKLEANENELITTMQLHFTEAGSPTPIIFSFDDPDGPGGNAPSKDLISLSPNREYRLQVFLLDKTKNPIVDITEEVEEEGDVHRIYVLPTGNVDLTVSDPDVDVNEMPVGTKYTITTGALSTGKLRIVLRHYEDGGKQTADGVDDPKSSTDADVTFDVEVE